MTVIPWGAVVVAGTLALAVPFGLRPLLHRFGAFDVPNHRSSHSSPTLRGGGVAPLLGMLGGGVWATLLLDGTTRLFVGVIIAAAVITGVIGLAEDIRGLRVAVRAALQFVIGAAVAITLGAAAGIHWLWIPVAALFFAAHVNFTNFMDGVNGISGLHGLVAGLLYAALGVATDLPGLIVIGLITSVAFAAFLPWNFASPGMFLGDVGSYLLGGVLGATAIAALSAGLNPVAALAPLSIYWADALTTLFRRAARGEPVFEAHRTHAYQRLTNTGFSHIAVAAVVAAFTAAAGGVGILVGGATLHWVLGAVFVVAVAGVFLALPRLRGDALPAVGLNDLSPVRLPPPSPARSDWNPTKWAVLGASGFIGRATVDHLREQGMDVKPLSAPRLQLDPKMLDGYAVAAIAGSHSAVAELTESLTGVDVVVNAAGLASPDGAADVWLFGANALLPAVIATAATQAGVGRLVHLSSAAVQGARPVLDTSAEVAPFSPYSLSKALGERAVLAVANDNWDVADIVVIRATSVQGPGRKTTEDLRRVARSHLASVAAPGDHPSVVSSLKGLVTFVQEAGMTRGATPALLLQPWEGLNVTEVFQLAGGRPVVLPAWLCRTLVRAGAAVGSGVPRVAGLVRRVEVMWFGQAQEGQELSAPQDRSWIRQALAGAPDLGQGLSTLHTGLTASKTEKSDG